MSHDSTRVVSLKNNLIIPNKVQIEKPKMDRKTIKLEKMTISKKSNPKRLDPVKYGGQT
jgi:hypothetical protein